MRIQSFKIGLISALVVMGLSKTAFSQAQDSVVRQKYVADEVVAVVGSSMVLLSDLKLTEVFIEDSYKERGYTGRDAHSEAFEALLVQKLLAARAAIDSVEVNQSSVFQQTEQQLSQIINQHGSVKNVENYYNRPIFSVREYIKDRVTESELARSMQNEVKAKVVLTPIEISKYYKGIDKDSLPIVPEQYIYSQIMRVAPQSDEARMNVKESLLAIRDRILKGSSFQAMARMYSEDPSSASRGGEMEPQVKESFVSSFAEALTTLKPGQISEVIETEFGFHIIQLIDVNNNLYHCRHILLKVKFSPEDLQSAVRVMDSVASKIRTDSLSFASAVEQFSEDDKSKQSQGVVANRNYEQYGARMMSNKFFKDEIGIDYEKLRYLKPGQVSSAFITYDDKLNEVVKVVKLDEIIPSHIANLKEDYTLLEDRALKFKQEEYFNEWLNGKIAEMYVKIEDKYKDIPLSNKAWLK